MSRNNNYKGMRWFKCDLQMQTPGDSQHWLGDKLKNDKSNAKDIAEKYARACYEEGLEVIAITDHNFLSKEFLHVLKQAFKDEGKKYGRKIVIFPGFEIEANVGTGCHVLCLFEPNRDLEDIDHILTDCGVKRPRKEGNKLTKSQKDLVHILSTVQKRDNEGNLEGIVILPHPFESDGIFSQKGIKEWLQQAEFKNEELLAIEIPKSETQLPKNWQILFANGADCSLDWRRTRPIATIMSSDNKMLNEKDENGKPKPNSIGYRYTWIKMSEPSIEALRQAFLDRESRIILPDNVTDDIPPNKRETHGRILSLTISNAEFLADQEIHFSQNLNCIIGGRGTGKSTVLEGLRIALGKEDDIKKYNNKKDENEASEEKVDRIKKLLARKIGTKLEITWQRAEGIKDTIVYEIREGGDGKKGIGEISIIEPSDVIDRQTFLANIPIQIFSQQQLNKITDRKNNMLLTILDEFIRDELNTLKHQEDNLRAEIRRLFSVKRQLELAKDDIRRLNQEISDLNRQIEALKELQGEFQQYQKLKAAGEYIKDVEDTVKDEAQVLSNIRQIVEDFDATHKSPNAVDNGWQHSEWFDKQDEKYKEAKQTLRQQVFNAIEHFQETVKTEYLEDESLPEIRRIIESADSEFQKSCEAKGVSSDDINRIQILSQQLHQKNDDLAEKQTEAQRLTDDVNKLPSLMNSLHENWRNRFKKRSEVADEINKMPKKYIKLHSKYAADEADFLNAWEKIIQGIDKRSRIGRNWQEIGKCIHQIFCNLSNSNDETISSPWELLVSYNEPTDLHDDLVDLLNRVDVKFKEIKALLAQEARDEWEEAQTTRVEDMLDLTLYRENGKAEAGKISDGSLSDGQRNTAALIMILAKGDTPLILDQPEDELDSNFIFHELVPMLRSMKTKRQIIVVTHNANLPVNADAELIYALETKDNRGVLRTCGALDRNCVREAVLDIMEGSETAFKRRREKYHF